MAPVTPGQLNRNRSLHLLNTVTSSPKQTRPRSRPKQLKSTNTRRRPPPIYLRKVVSQYRIQLGMPSLAPTDSNKSNNTTSSARPLSPTVNMSAPAYAGQGSSSSSKAPAADHDPSDGGFKPQQQMTVQPPSKDDLQRSYATVVDADANPKGWYGTMSMYFPSRRRLPMLAPARVWYILYDSPDGPFLR